ncbi:hypothetical protein QQF64_035869 [Cirrhinus molitorella]|uniref:Uncharacterized protein n=1 Tax=Cirrhinus molitorella TaxID=172907 RepID=A0ABR3NHQ8_9TELE
MAAMPESGPRPHLSRGLFQRPLLSTFLLCQDHHVVLLAPPAPSSHPDRPAPPWLPARPAPPSSSITERERKKLDRVIRRSSSVLGCPLDSVWEVGTRRILTKLTSMLDHESQPCGTFCQLWRAASTLSV